MSSVSQTIPNFIFGINEQPDYLKRPGQVRDSLNMTPDVTKGLIKRPGSRFVCHVTDEDDGKWFNYYRSDEEQYVGHIQDNGYVRVWNVDGTPATVTQLSGVTNVSTTDNYLTHTAASDLQTLTVNDYTFISNRTQTVAYDSTVLSGVPKPEGIIEIKVVAAERTYEVDVRDKYGSIIRELTKDSGATGTTPSISSDTILDEYKTIVETDLVTSVTSVSSLTNSGGNTNRPAGVYTPANFTTNSTSGKGLVFTIQVAAGGSIDVNNIVILSGGLDYAVNDVITIPDSDLGGGGVGNVTFNVATIGSTGYKFVATKIGNTLHVKSVDPTNTANDGEYFSLEANDVSTQSVFTDSVNNVERLPYQCKHGYKVKVVNSTTDEDDYYAIFEGQNDNDGAGVWQETVGWTRNVDANTGAFANYAGITRKLNPTTMPHVLICTALNTFTVAPADGATPSAGDAMSYAARDVGDLNTNPDPSFVGSKVNQLLLFRNRLVFLSNENVVMTTSGGLKPVNFYSTSALTSLATDPIDLSAASKQPALLWDGLEVNNGFLLFAENQQYLMTTDSDLLTQETTKLNAIGYYPYSKSCVPFSLGTTVGFVDNTGSNFRMFEMSNISRDGEPTVIEQSKPVSRLTPGNITKIADSRESSMVLFSTDDTGAKDIVWGYRYFQDGPERQLSSWFKWQLSGDVLYHCVMRDRYYVVIRYGSNNKLIELDLQDTADTAVLNINDNSFQIHLDNRVTIPTNIISYASGVSTFTMPQNDSTNVLDPTHKDIYAYVIDDGDNQGSYQKVTVNTNTCTLTGDWSSDPLEIGYNFSTNVTIPQFYITQAEGRNIRANTRSSLVIHRLFMETGSIGSLNYTLERVGKGNYTGSIEPIVFDQYESNDPSLAQSLSTYIPVYERNTNIVLKLHSENPTPFSLFSIAWEGDISNRYYRNA